MAHLSSLVIEQGLVHVLIIRGYNLEQILEGDVQNPQKGTFTNHYQPLLNASEI